MSQHTPEPWVGEVDGMFNDDHDWSAESDGATTSGFVPLFARDKVVALVVTTSFRDDEMLANARRIVACVNACRDHETEELEELYDGTSMTLKFVMECASDHISELQSKNDELMAILKRWVDDDDDASLIEMRRVTKEAIAKAEAK